MDELKQDIRNAMAALYPEAIERAETPEWWKNPTLRGRALENIKTLICALRPNAGECADIVDEIGGSLRLRYDDATESLLYGSLFKLALERLDVGYQVDARDELAALEAQVQRSQRRAP